MRNAEVNCKGVLLQQDNVRVPTCTVAMDAVERNGYELIPHPAYLPDLAPSDFFLFPMGWFGGAKVSCILRHQGVQLILAYSWARPAILVAGKGRGEMFLLLLFHHFHSCSSFFLVPHLHLFYYLFYLFSLFLGGTTNSNTINLPIPKLEKWYLWTSFPVWWRSRDGSWGVGQWKGPWLFQFWADGIWTPLV